MSDNLILILGISFVGLGIACGLVLLLDMWIAKRQWQRADERAKRILERVGRRRE